MRNQASVLLLILGGILASGPANAQTTPPSTLYLLNSDTSFERGCFPPCMCPVMIAQPVRGIFLLTPSGSNSLFSTNTITDVNWVLSIDGTNVTVTGSGTYIIGGEFALEQELSLELRLDGGDVQHFDSGLVVGPAPFPEIKVSISLHGMVCFDTVFNVSASPAPVEHLRPSKPLQRRRSQLNNY